MRIELQANERLSNLGYSPAPDNLRLHNRLALYHRKRTWGLSCSVETGTAGSRLLGNEVHLIELASLGFFLIWYSMKAMSQQATIDLRKKWCQLSMGGFRRILRRKVVF